MLPLTLCWIVSALSLSFSAEVKLPDAAGRKVDYEEDVRPLLAEHCYSCHGPEAQQAGLRLDLRQNALRGGDYGPVIIPGESARSKLVHKLVDGDGGKQMPPDGALAPADIGILRAWIDQGAEFRNEIKAQAPPAPIDPKLAEIISAVRSAQLPAVRKALKQSPNLFEGKDPSGSTLLHHAAGFGTLETVKWLLDAGVNVNSTNRRGSTPLHWAIADKSKVRLLLSRGANVNQKQVEGRTPLYLAASLGNGNKILKLLLDHGADPEIALANGRRPLMAAAERGDVDAMRLLIEAKARVNARNGAGETALILAASCGQPDAVQFLLDRGANLAIMTKRDESALGNAATAGDEKTVGLLLEHGAPINSRNIRGYSPLMLAASSDTIPTAVVKLLLARGADTSFQGDYEESARELAAKRGNTEVARLLGAGPQEGLRRPARDGGPYRIPEAVERALIMTEKQSHNFIRIAGCNSCHSQDLPSAAAAFARSRGLSAPRVIEQLPASMLPPAERLMDLDFVGTVGSKAWELFDFGMNGEPRNAYTDAVIHLIRVLQSPDGYWPAAESRRPPVNTGEFQTAALSIYALKHYAPPGQEAACEKAIERAVAWLERAPAKKTQDLAFQALGFVWANAASEKAGRAAKALVAAQNTDGGWSQLPTMQSDAYATGQALYALFATRFVAVTDPPYQRGVDYLLKTQAEDGTWHVQSRSIWLQPYFESGFPYGRDQFISTAGTAWASMALAATHSTELTLK